MIIWITFEIRTPCRSTNFRKTKLLALKVLDAIKESRHLRSHGSRTRVLMRLFHAPKHLRTKDVLIKSCLNSSFVVLISDSSGSTEHNYVFQWILFVKSLESLNCRKSTDLSYFSFSISLKYDIKFNFL